jgi:transcription initiation factor TFIIB
MNRVLSPGEVLEEVPEAPPQELEYVQDLSVTLMCPECKEMPPNLVDEFSSGDTVCGSCGFVLGEHVIDTRSEWRTFSNDDQGNDDPSRVGDAANPLLDGSQLHTGIAYGEGGRMARDLNRTQNKNTQDKSTRALLHAYKQIQAYTETMQLPSKVGEAAKDMFKQVEDARLFKGKSTDAVIAGCLFIACRQMEYPRTFREIFQLTQVPKKEIGRIFKQLERFLTMKSAKGPSVTSSGLVQQTDDFKATPSTKAEGLINRYCSQLAIKYFITQIAKQIAQRVDIIDTAGQIGGRSPVSIASAAIYMASHLMGDGRSGKEISKVANVSDGTIRTSYKLMYEKRDDLITDEMLKQGGKMEALPTG